MPEMGKYAGTVLGAYAVAVALILGLVALSLWQSARARRALAAREERSRSDG